MKKLFIILLAVLLLLPLVDWLLNYTPSSTLNYQTVCFYNQYIKTDKQKKHDRLMIASQLPCTTPEQAEELRNRASEALNYKKLH